MRSWWRVFGKLTACLALLAIALPARAADAEYVAGRLLAGYRGDPDSPLLLRTLAMHRAVMRRHLPNTALYRIDVPEEASAAILESLRGSGLFDYVERDYYAHTAGDPNDPSFGSQWYLRQIAAADAWNLTTGSSATIIAVVDSGIFASHADLSGKLVPGWNFVQSNADTADVLGHGTAVAGTLAAATNNGIGVAGVNWGSRVMPLVVVDAGDFAAYSDIAAAIRYAADHGVRIINVSIGGTSPSATLQDAVNYAWSKDSVVFASAMNSSTATAYYPAACTHVVAVSATDANDHLASFSSFGSWIVLAAPGTNILTTMNGGGYGYWNGTSFASPIVAGVAALVLAAQPQLSNADLVQLLRQTADPVGDPGYFGAGRVNAYRAVRAVLPPSHRRRSPLAPPEKHR
jgi:subtilisin family serine protease